jgi:hypothetical protein
MSIHRFDLNHPDLRSSDLKPIMGVPPADLGDFDRHHEFVDGAGVSAEQFTERNSPAGDDRETDERETVGLTPEEREELEQLRAERDEDEAGEAWKF